MSYLEEIVSRAERFGLDAKETETLKAEYSFSRQKEIDLGVRTERAEEIAYSVALRYIMRTVDGWHKK